MIDELRKLDDEERVIGTNETLRLLRKDELEKVFLAENAPDEVKEDIQRYAELNGIEYTVLDVDNDELGVAMRKPFNIAVVGQR